jgi:uncharacterized protein
MKYLLVLLVIVIVIWLFSARSRERVRGDARPPPAPPNGRSAPQAMACCAHCGLHLPAADAVIEGTHVYCSDAHRRLGPDPAAGR